MPGFNSAPRYRPACSARRCERSRAAGHLMCRDHWFAVPKEIRDQVLATYRRNAGLRQSPEYFDAITAAIASLEPGPAGAAG